MLGTLFKGSDVTYKVTLGESGSLLTGSMKALLCGVGIDSRQTQGPLLPLPGSYSSHLPAHGFRLSLISQAVILKGASSYLSILLGLEDTKSSPVLGKY